jgi:hypothetical protein
MAHEAPETLVWQPKLALFRELRPQPGHLTLEVLAPDWVCFAHGCLESGAFRELAATGWAAQGG